MTKTTKALLRIRPLEFFFFGSESTFGNGDGANYFARSNSFPQQTTVLGLLRRLLFDEKKPIGESFRAEADPKSQQNFGEIVGLSPVFLMDEEGIGWLPHALDAHSETETGCKTEPFAAFNFSTERNIGKAFTGLGKEPIWGNAPYFENADAKKWLTELLISQTGDTCDREHVFKKFTRIGITKFRRGGKKEDRRDAFYKQEMFKLAKCWSFAIEVELKDGFDASFFNGKTVVLGGEKCLARVEVAEKQASFHDIFQAKEMYEKRPAGQVVLLSDALVSDDLFKNCVAAVAETTTFRNILTPASPKSYGPIKPTQNPDFLSKTSKTTLLKSGSVLFGNAEKIAEELESQTHFRQIGYNHYLIF